jgi:membrane protein
MTTRQPQPTGHQTYKTRLLSKLYELFDSVYHHEAFMLSGSLAYTIALALAPFFIIMLTTLSLLDGGSQQFVVAELTGVLGPQAGEALKAITSNAEKEIHFAGISGIISFVVIAVSASAIFSQLRVALDIINDYRAPQEPGSRWRSFFKQRVFSVGLVFAFILLMIVSMVVTTVLGVVFRGADGIIWQSVFAVGNFLVFSLLFSAIFRFIPSERRPWSRCVFSGITATLFFLLGKYLIGLYISHSAVGSAYGAAGSLIVLLVWLYYMSFSLLISYEFSNRIFGLKQEKLAAEGGK